MQRLETKPLLTIRTPIGLIDRRWLQMIEPDIFRPGPEHEACGCWLYQAHCNRDGEPVTRITDIVTGKRTTRLLKKLVAEIFVLGWRDDYSVFHECGNKNCLKPEHLLFTKLHHTQFDLARHVTRKKTYLKEIRTKLLRSAAASE